MKYLLCNNAATLRRALAEYSNTATVEAEYGDEVVTGTEETWAHHGPRSANPPPCIQPNVEHRSVRLGAVGLSHLDLDALGGCLALHGNKCGPADFWTLAGWVDTHGPHKLSGAFSATQENLDRLYAWWAWSEEHRVYAPRDGSVLEVNDWIVEAAAFLDLLFANDHSAIEAGRVFASREAELNHRSHLVASQLEEVVVRKCDQFVNHLYACPVGRAYAACAALNTETGAITVSLADPIPGVSCRAIVQSRWGNEAGGHDGIAGSPRGLRYDAIELIAVAEDLEAAIRHAKEAPCMEGPRPYQTRG